MDTIKEYIDFSQNKELWKEATRVNGLGLSIFEKGREEGKREATLAGIQALIEDNLEEQIPRERSLEKLQRHFHLTEERAIEYYERFAGKV